MWAEITTFVVGINNLVAITTDITISRFLKQ
jgi:hypothetical protein